MVQLNWKQVVNIKDAIFGRRAIREFTQESVEDAALRALIDAAVQAPSAVNQQPWFFTIVRNKERLAHISSEAKSYMLKTSLAEADSHHFLPALSDPKFDIFYGAPALVVISAAAGPWAVEDCSLAAENLMLTAHAAGLGTCWIGFAQSWLDTPEGKSALKLPDTQVVVAPIIVGHPRSVLPSVLRRPPRIEWIS
jgi:nitroreductase